MPQSHSSYNSGKSYQWRKNISNTPSSPSDFALQDQLFTSSTWHPWLFIAQHCRKNCGHFQSIQRTNKTQKNCDGAGNTLQAIPQIRQKLKKKCSLYMDHIILERTWIFVKGWKQRKISSFLSKQKKSLSSPWSAVVCCWFLFHGFHGMVRVSTVALPLLKHIKVWQQRRASLSQTSC